MKSFFEKDNIIQSYKEWVEGKIAVQYSNGETELIEPEERESLEDQIRYETQKHIDLLPEYIALKYERLVSIVLGMCGLTLGVVSFVADPNNIIIPSIPILMGTQGISLYVNSVIIAHSYKLPTKTTYMRFREIINYFKKYKVYYENEELIKGYFDSQGLNDNFLNTPFNGEVNTLDNISRRRLLKLIKNIKLNK